MPFPIYLDYNGTTPIDAQVIDAMRPFLETEFGNPSSSHFYGLKPRQAVAVAREQVAGLLNCRPEEVFFTSGGTESNNHAIQGIANAHKTKGRHIITSAFEHPAVLEVCRYLQSRGFETSYVPVNSQGMVDPAAVGNAIRKDTILISLMHANNEVGTIQPIEEISAIAKSQGIAMHTDSAQALGKIPTDVQVLGVDLLSIAGHKLYAPKGIGALYVRNGLELGKFCHGAGQEMGRRSGTENVMHIVGLGEACAIAVRNTNRETAHLITLRDRLHQGIIEQLNDVCLNGHPDYRLPNTVSLAFKNLAADSILAEIDPDVAASPGAACHSDTVSISHVLSAMQVPLEWAKGTIRFSLGRMTTIEQIDRAIGVVVRAVHKLRAD